MVLKRVKQFHYFMLPLLFTLGLRAETTCLHLVFTNDIHGALHKVPARFINPEFAPDLTGGAGAYNYVKSVRSKAEQRNESVLLTDGGNLFQGTPLGTQDGGSKMIQWMNWMEYDAFVPGVKDFDQGKKNLIRLKEEASFPFLAANLKGVEGVLPYTIKAFDGFNVGLIGLITPDLKDGSLPKNMEGVSVDPPLDVLNRIIPEVRSKGADLVFVLAHMGLPYDREIEYEKMVERVSTGAKIRITNALELAHFAQDVDVIITGGISKGYDTPWEDPLTHTLVLQNYGNLTGIGHLKLDVDLSAKVITGYTFPTDRGMMITLFQDDIWPDFEMADSIKSWVDAISNTSESNHSELISTIRSLPAQDCPDQQPPAYDEYNIPMVGQVNDLDIMTWNIERFPIDGEKTMKAVAEIIRDLNVDIIGVQEVIKIGKFAEMMSWLPEYDFVLSQQSSFLEQAIIYRKEILTLLGQQEPFAFDDYFFAGRPPLLVDFLWRCGQTDIEITFVNMHLKCCGDGLYRRQQSMKQLHSFLRDRMDLGMDKIIVVGDWNDQIQDEGIYQSFSPFMDDREHFLFVTELIADDPSQQSYPTWPSFLDHILIGKGFFELFDSNGTVRSVNIDEWMGSWDVYENLISDHRPILLSLPLD